MDNLDQIVEALIFASDSPLPAKKIKDLLELDSVTTVKQAITNINKRYEKSDSALQIIEVADGFQVVTREAYADWIAKLYSSRSSQRLTHRALETLAIIAYKQPITKQEIESIRGVSADHVIRTLIERNLITVTGRQKAPGNPLLYGTTKFFLEIFGIKNLEDLPKLKEIDELLKSDEQFLESLDQVSLQQLFPEELGITSMLNVNQESPDKDKKDESENKSDQKNEPDKQDRESKAKNDDEHDREQL